MVDMVCVLKPGGVAIYVEPSTLFSRIKLLRQNGLQIEKKTMDIAFGVKPPYLNQNKINFKQNPSSKYAT